MNAHNRIDANLALSSPAATVRLSAYYVRDRSPNRIVLGLNTTEQKRAGLWAVEIIDPAVRIEIGQTLLIAPARFESRTWRNGFVAKTMIAERFEIEPYVGRVSPKIDGIDSAVCANLAKRLGADFARIIADDPSTLESFRYSPEKRRIIAKACAYEAAAASKVHRSQKLSLDGLIWAGESKTKARSLLHTLQMKNGRGGDSPYRLLFEGRQTFKTADRFAFKYDPEAAERDRPQAIVIAALRALAETEGHSIATADEIENRAWKDFGLSSTATRAAIETLKDSGVVTAIKKPMSQTEISGRQLFGMVGAAPSFIGLATLVEAERRVLSFAEDANRIGASINTQHASGRAPEMRTRIVERTIADAAKSLARPGFELDEQQAIALRRIFANPLSIVTGPPGSGKTTIAALANVAASGIYPDANPAIYGVALAGRAASMLQDAASLPSLEFSAATIHRALGLDADADALDAPAARSNIDARVLVIDESSMINSILLAAVLNKTTAEHVVLLGDIDQLPPIGAGAPFADMIAKGLVPVTRLERNYRTDLTGIRDLTRAINDGAVQELSAFAKKGGVTYREQAFGGRGGTAASIWRGLAKRGVTAHEIAVITPRNVGDEGTSALNRDIRFKLGFDAALQVGDIILVTKNDYRAPLATASRAASKDDEVTAIYNGERCVIVERRADTFDGFFPGGSGRASRSVRFLHNGENPPEGTAYGYAMTVHKAQGSQFDHVILVTARPDRFVSRASVYTAASRARKRLTIIGDECELAECADREERPRRTYLSLIGKAAHNG